MFASLKYKNYFFDLKLNFELLIRNIKTWLFGLNLKSRSNNRLSARNAYKYCPIGKVRFPKIGTNINLTRDISETKT